MWLNEIQAKLNLRHCWPAVSCWSYAPFLHCRGWWVFLQPDLQATMFVCCCLSWLVLAECFSTPFPPPAYGKYMVSTLGSTGQQCDSTWVDATLRIVKVTHWDHYTFLGNCSHIWGSTSLTGISPTSSSLLMSLIRNGISMAPTENDEHNLNDHQTYKQFAYYW